MSPSLRRWLRGGTYAFASYIALFGAVNWLFPNSSFPPTGKTGAPGDTTCQDCHSSASVTNPSGDLSLSFSPTIPSGYSPGTTYDLTFSISNPGGRQGFEVLAQKTSNNGSLSAFTNAGSNSGTDGTYWYHSGSANSWTVKWTAPSVGNGTVRFYTIANKGGASPFGDFHRQTFDAAEGAAAPPSPSISAIAPNFASVAATVTLSGTDFGPTQSSVTFTSGVLAACSSWSDTLIVCTVPSGAVTGNVTVTNSTGTSPGKAFTVVGTPAVTSISPNFGAKNDAAFRLDIFGNDFSGSGASVKLTKSGQTDIPGTGFGMTDSRTATANFDLTGATTGQWSVVLTNPDAQSGTLTNGLAIQVLPPAPSGLNATVVSPTSIYWRWTDNSDNELGMRVTNDGGGSYSGDLPADTTFYLEFGLTPNLLVDRRAQAFNDIGNASSNLVNVYTFAAQPASVTAGTLGVSSVTVSWNDNGNEAGTSYAVQLSSNAFATLAAASTATTTSRTFNSLAANTTYLARVEAINGDGIATAFSTSPVLRTLPDATAAPSFSTLGVSSIVFQWTAGTNPNASSLTYQAQLSTNNFTTVNLTSSTAILSVVFSTLTANTTYFFRSRAVNASGSGAFGPTASTSTLANAPASVSITSLFVSSGAAAWTASGSFYKAEASSDSFASIAASSTTSLTSATFQALPANTTYQVRVQAFNANSVPTAFTLSGSSTTFPDATAAPAFSTIGASSIAFNWTAGTNPNAGALTYAVQVATEAAFSTTTFSLSTPTASAVFSPLTPNTTYFFRAQAVNSRGAGPTGPTASTATLANAPVSLAVGSRTSYSVDLTWTGSAAAFEVSVSTDGFASSFTGVPFSSGLTAGATTVLGLTINTTYSFRLRGRNPNGVPTDFSNVVTTGTLNFPNAPSAFSGTPLSTGSIKWNWTDNSTDEAGSRVYSSTNGLLSPDLAANTTFYVLGGLAANSAVNAHAVAFAPGGVAESPASNSAAVFTLATAPSGSAAAPVPLSSTTLKVSWSTANASGYALERATASAGTFSVAVGSSTLTASTSFYTDSGLAAKTTYFYRVRGFNGDGIPTAYDGTVSTRTFPAPPAAPTLTGEAISTSSIRWSWTLPADVTGFELETSTGGSIVYLVPTVSSYTETGLTPGTAYTRFVTAFNETGETASAPATAATASEAQPVSNAVVNQVAVAGSTVTIPAGALGGDGTLQASSDPENKPLTSGLSLVLGNASATLGGNQLVPGSLRQFVAYVGGSRFTSNFNSPVLIVFSYADADGDGVVDGTTLRVEGLSILTLSESGGAWAPLTGIVVDKAARTVSGYAAHFSLFSLAAVSATDLSAVRIFPNPYLASQGHTFVRFASLPVGSAVRIYTVAGESVRKLDAATGQVDWDARNEAGQNVASGIYLVVVESGGEKRRLKVGVQR